jgi:hypothetical protein
VDSEVRNTTGQTTTVKQPLPLPEGVSNNAVGNNGYVSAYKRSAAPVMMKLLSTLLWEDKIMVDEDVQSVNFVDVKDDSLVDNTIYSIVDIMPVFEDRNIQAFQAYVKNISCIPQH